MMNNPENRVGIVSMGRSYTEGNVHLVSNYWGLDTFFDAPIPEGRVRVAHIPTATNLYAEFGRACRFLDAERAWLADQEEKGKLESFEFCISGKQPEEVAEGLEGADVLFMSGGNTAYLLQQLQDSGAGEVIKRMVGEGTWYLGKSAGAIVAGPDINPRGFFLGSMATRELDDTTGLGLIEAFPMPHVDTPSIMNSVYDGKPGWQHAMEMCGEAPLVCLVDRSYEEAVSG